MKRFFQAAVAAGVVMAFALPAVSDEQNTYPRLSGSVSIELQNDYAFASDTESEEFNSLSATIEPSFTLGLSKQFSINTGLVFEPVQSPPVAGDNRFFDDQGLYIETLTLDFTDGPVHLSGGKMGVNFGKAWDITPGIYGTDLAEEYELAENIGLKAAFSHDFGHAGTHTLTTQTFFADTSIFAESAFARRKKTRQHDGGPGNTGDFSSYALALDGHDFQVLPGLDYHLAFVHRGNDTTGAEDEQRYAAGASYQIDLSKEIIMTPMAEYAVIQDAGGTKDQENAYFTAALGGSYKQWNAAVSTTLKEAEAPSGTTTDTEQYQISAGYAFENGFALDVAYKRTRNAGIDTDTVGTLLSYAVSF